MAVAWRASRRREPGSRTCPASTLVPSLPNTAGSSVSVAASTAMTDNMMPSAIDRNAGLGTSSTVDSDTSTVTPEKAIALPAVPMVSAIASIEACLSPGCAPRRRRAARKRTTRNRA